MIGLVHLRVGEAAYAVPIGSTLGVRRATRLLSVPVPAAGVVGLLPFEDRTIPVVAPLGGGGHLVVVLTSGGAEFALLVDDVQGVVAASDGHTGPAPAGQADPLVSAVINMSGTPTLVLDVAALARVCGVERE